MLKSKPNYEKSYIIYNVQNDAEIFFASIETHTLRFTVLPQSCMRYLKKKHTGHNGHFADYKIVYTNTLQDLVAGSHIAGTRNSRPLIPYAL